MELETECLVASEFEWVFVLESESAFLFVCLLGF